MWPKSQIWVIKHKTNNTHNTDNTTVDDFLWALLPVPALRLENEVTLFGMVLVRVYKMVLRAGLWGCLLAKIQNM
jgi:hypothetical protein